MTEERTRTHRQLAGDFQAAQAEIDRMKAAASDAAASDAAAGDTAAGDAAAGDTAAVATHIVKPLQPGPKQPYDPFVAEMLRQIVSYGKVPKHNVPAVMALCHAAMTRKVPDDTSLTSSSHVDEAFAKLGALDAEDRAAANATDSHSFAVASDGGSDNKQQREDGLQGRSGVSCCHTLEGSCWSVWRTRDVAAGVHGPWEQPVVKAGLCRAACNVRPSGFAGGQADVG